MTKSIALIPARAGSKRVPYKNIKPLAGHPLIAYTISAALDSGCFEKVLVSSDDTETLEIAHRYGADCLRRPDDLATDTSPDIEWVRHALKATMVTSREYPYPDIHSYDTFSILRPTSPFRKPETIQRAFGEWKEYGQRYSSLRAVEPVSQHPGKMWYVHGYQDLVPLMMQPREQPFHDSQMASLPPVYVQNASLEIAHVATVLNTGTISGKRIMSFHTGGDEGLDINSQRDWDLAEFLIDRGDITLPAVRKAENVSHV